MIKKNNKGFTLLELLISIFILTTVIFLGYKVINKSTMDIKNQGNINKGQLTVNDMNEYLTKDLEKARSIALLLDNQEIANTKEVENNTQQDILKAKVTDLEKKLSEGNNFSYSYKIKFEEDKNIKLGKSDEISKYNVTYQVNFIKKDENNYKYNIKRIDENDGVSITFADDEKFTIVDDISIELPFTIEGNSPYKVLLGYNGKNNEFEKYEFTVTSRLYGALVGDGNTNPGDGDDTTLPPVDNIKPPSVDNIKPPEEWGDNPIIPTDYNAIGFWTADSGKRKKDNLYTWISTHGTILGEAYADQETGKNDKFNIEGFARPENKGQTASYIGYNTMDKDNNWKGQVKDVYIGEKNIVKISIYVSPNTKLENFKIQKLQGNADIQIPETLNEGWHHCTITTNSQVSFKFKGELSIDKSQVDSGYAYVVYEREGNSTLGDGDIVFEFTRKAEKSVDMTMEINVGNTPKKSPPNNTANNNHNFVALVKTDSQSRIDLTGVGDFGSYDENFKTVKGVEVKLLGNIFVPRFKIDNIMSNEISLPLNYNNKFYFTQPGQYGVRFNEVRFDNLKNGETGRIIVNLIY